MEEAEDSLFLILSINGNISLILEDSVICYPFFLIGVGGSMLFDWTYDNADNIVDTVSHIGEDIVNTVGML